MSNLPNVYELPEDLPVPVDDGACDHLTGLLLPPLSLPSTPTFTVDGMTLIKRVTLVIENGRIIKVFYPIFPPDQNAADVVAWLSRQQ
jgi:hypothetical protein